MSAWYLVYTKSQQERVALENLSRQRYTAYLPLLRYRRRRKNSYDLVVVAASSSSAC